MFFIFKSIVQATKLDIFDLNYLVGTESCRFLDNNPAILPRKGLFVRVFAYALHLLQALGKTFVVKKIPKGAILFFVSTRNQRDAVSALASSVDKAIVAGEGCVLEFNFPLFWAYLFALPFLPCLFLAYLNAGKYHRKTFTYMADIYLLTYGYHFVGRLWLEIQKPRCFVTANDHSMYNTVMTNIARELNVPTVYLQHASVTEKFPPLSFDYALLEGQDALQKYEKKGLAKTRVYLIGMPKADAYAGSVNHNPAVGRLGICCNMLDEENDIEGLCREIADRLPGLAVILRPHPSDKRRFSQWKNISATYGMEYSDPLSENAFGFLGRVDAVVAGESNIHLEAALLEVYPLYFDFSGRALDWYGFLKNGVVEYFSDAESLCRKILLLVKEKPSVRQRCKFYCHTVGTSHEWQSSLLAKNLIESIAARHIGQEASWRPLTPTTVQVFQPD
jgi:hypothetical protein